MPAGFHRKDVAGEKRPARDSANESAAVIAALQKDLATSEGLQKTDSKVKGRAQGQDAGDLGPGWRRERDLRV